VTISGKPDAQLVPGKGNLVVTGDDSSSVNVYNYPVLQKKPPVKKFKGHSAHVQTVLFTPNDKYLISNGSGDLALIQWRVKHPGDPEEDPEEPVAEAQPADSVGDGSVEQEEKKIQSLLELINPQKNHKVLKNSKVLKNNKVPKNKAKSNQWKIKVPNKSKKLLVMELKSNKSKNKSENKLRTILFWLHGGT